MKSGWGVGHAEEHDGRFIESSVGDEGGFPLVSFFYSDIVIPPLYVKLGEDLGVLEFVDEIGNQGKGICIPDSVAIKVSVVLARSEAAILFFDEEERGSLGGFEQTNFPRAKVFIDELVCSLSFFDGEGIKFSYVWDKGVI